MNIIINGSIGRGLAGITHAHSKSKPKIFKKMGLRVSKQDGKIKKGKSYQGELTESKSNITPASADVKSGALFASQKM
jgi:hypothetical protein